MRRFYSEEEIWDEEMHDGYEEVYQNALMTVRLVEENRALRRENEHLKKQVEEHRGYINKQYRETNRQVGNILSKLVEKQL